jgi:hypothetical protein
VVSSAEKGAEAIETLIREFVVLTKLRPRAGDVVARQRGNTH